MVVLMGRWPVLGEGKTRLAAEAGEAKAHEIHKLLFDHALRAFASCPSGCVLAVTGLPDGMSIEAASGRLGLPVILQRGEDLGARMLGAIADASRLPTGDFPVTVVGTDLPTLTLAHVLRAERALELGADAAAVPATDGGFGLMCMRHWPPDLWGREMAWGTDRVWDQTQVALRRRGLRCAVDDPVQDIDTWADWVAFCQKHPTFASYGSK